MGIFKDAWSTIGYIIGAIIILPVLLLIFNLLFINKNDSKPVLKDYVKNSIEEKVNPPSIFPKGYKPTASNVDSFYFYQSKRVLTSLGTKNMGRSANTNTKMEYRIFYIECHKKYFSIVIFDNYHEGVPQMADAFWSIINDKALFITINKDDLKNPQYGSKENPVPVFKVRGADRPLTEFWDESKPTIQYDVSEDQYHYNVLMYLTFVMSRKEFNKRFKKPTKFR